jgi:hypothetical protein
LVITEKTNETKSNKVVEINTTRFYIEFFQIKIKEQTKMTNTIKNTIRSVMGSIMLGISAIAPRANAAVLDERVFLDTQAKHTRTELRVSNNGNRALADFDGTDSRFGAQATKGQLTLNGGYQKVAELEATRTYAQFGKDTKVAAGYQALEGKTDFWETYLTTKAGKSDLELGVNALDHVTGVARMPINKDNSIATVFSLSTQDANYRKIAGALAHSGKVGFLTYAIIGENNDGSQYRDVRIRGGVGNKTGAKASGIVSLNESCFFDESAVCDITDPLFTGSFGNYGANVRGDPIGFDVRYLNGKASSQVAVKIGKVTLVPTYKFDTDTSKQGLNLEIAASLGKGFYLRAQNRANEDLKPEQGVMLGYSTKF